MKGAFAAGERFSLKSYFLEIPDFFRKIGKTSGGRENVIDKCMKLW